MIFKNDYDLAWKVYNYFNIWGGRLFGTFNKQSATYALIVTLIAYRGTCLRDAIISELSISSNTLDLALTELEYHYHLIEQTGGVYTLAKPFLKSLTYLEVNLVGKDVFHIMLRNISKHIDILKENVSYKSITEILDLMSYLLDPLTGRHIPDEVGRVFTKLGYMKRKGSAVLLNELAYKKDWTSTDVI